MTIHDVTLRYIGIVRTEHRLAEKTPIQPQYAEGCFGWVQVYPEYEKGLLDIEGFSHLYLIYHLHQAPPPKLVTTPLMADEEHGVFATRAPCRPNPIGMSLVRLLGRDGRSLQIRGVDILDGTPLLDIKPFAPKYDLAENPRGGWTDAISPRVAQERGRRGYVPTDAQ